MTTKKAGGRISGAINLTLEATVALAVGDPVHLTDDYTCVKADGSKPVVGHVVTANVKRTSSATDGSYPVALTPGDVAVEARGFAVQVFTAGASAITAGTLVGWGALSTLVPAGGGVATIGIALMTVEAGEKVDVLVQ